MKTTRPDSETSGLQDILTRLTDSIEGLRMAADFATDADLIRLCERTANTRESMAEELAAIIAGCGAEPSLEGSREAAVHRAWIRFTCQLHPKFRGRLRSECERGEREFQRTLDSRNLPAARSERTGKLLADLRYSVATTITPLRHPETVRQSPASRLAAA